MPLMSLPVFRLPAVVAGLGIACLAWTHNAAAQTARTTESITPRIDAPEQLISLERNGMSLAQLVFGAPRSEDNAALSKRPGYRSIVTALQADLAVRKGRDVHLSVTMSRKHRLFDGRWLTSPDARWELIGVINRMDRAPFAADPKFACGEVRLLYRLAYQLNRKGTEVYSRLPATMNVVYWASSADGDSSRGACAGIAKDWTKKSSPVTAAALRPDKLKSIEINLQSVRWPSTVRPDMGGYAEYLLRVFHREAGGTFKEAPMENMPDVARIKRSPALRNELKQWLRSPENIAAISAGVGVVPEKFLATEAMSVALHGLARAANRPWDQIFSAADFAGVKFGDESLVRSPTGYLRRLNDLSCVGCHQVRSVAGFHFAGIDRPTTLAANAIAMPASAHFAKDQKRRADYLGALIAGRQLPVERPFAERAADVAGTYGDHCGLGRDPTFAGWRCSEGFTCRPWDTNQRDSEVGICYPDREVLSGDPCDSGRVSWNENPLIDKMVAKTTRDCGKHRGCFAAGDGFPGGMCFGECATIRPGEACAAIAVGGFNPCLGRGELFTKCLENHTSDITMRACSESEPCRDDFICARTPKGTGACIPPYFLFQLRLDGHPEPTI